MFFYVFTFMVGYCSRKKFISCCYGSFHFSVEALNFFAFFMVSKSSLFFYPSPYKWYLFIFRSYFP